MTNQRQTSERIMTTTTTTDHYNNRSTGGGSSTGTGARACARARDDEAEASRAAMLRGQYVDCCEYYAQSFRRAIPFVVQREIAERIRDGMSADVIRAAMDETQTAPRPYWAYCAAILRRCDGEGIRSLADWKASKERRYASRNPAMDYQQREYTEDMFGDDFFANTPI